jgi:hypothetical protein
MSAAERAAEYLRKAKEANGWIYAARILNTGRIKIGFTKGLNYRIHNLRSHFRSEVEILGVMHANIASERQIHSRFKAHLANDPLSKREVYLPAQEILDFIQQNMTTPEASGAQKPPGKPYQPRPANSYFIGRLGCINLCIDIQFMRRYGHPEREKELTEKIARRIRERAESGRDVSEMIAIVRDRLGLDLAQEAAA